MGKPCSGCSRRASQRSKASKSRVNARPSNVQRRYATRSSNRTAKFRRG